MIHPRFGGAAPHFRVRLGSVRPQFRHIAKHSHAPAGAWKFFQRLQRRDHRVGVGVVGVVQHAHAFGRPDLHPHGRRPALGQAALNFFAPQTQLSSHCRRQHGVHQLVAAQKIHPILAANRFVCRFHLEARA